ncbi:30S ribosomal protein S6 [Candidatus Terasakiella magnetica]|uniref:Small ribosomal subunit protein bS6 n=1 Tax=Candidatus Terasakiella magnetica TaxID=1867952 RepID=A0A1C3RJX6_9PROT|nr:30S ribosomal protein S6 [Candidatus Terasakiella magnetica]SCA57551.1 30S ribosomal protein S6 [Candidatus Terasakiella magnetica]
MAFYEGVFIARQDASAAQVEGLQDTFAALIEENGGKVTKREYWGLRNIAYRMKKNRKGHYVLFNIDAPSPAIDELSRQLRLNEDVLRHLVVRVDELDEEQSIMMQKGRDRDDRPRRGGDRGDRPQRDNKKGGDS